MTYYNPLEMSSASMTPTSSWFQPVINSIVLGIILYVVYLVLQTLVLNARKTKTIDVSESDEDTDDEREISSIKANDGSNQSKNTEEKAPDSNPSFKGPHSTEIPEEAIKTVLRIFDTLGQFLSQIKADVVQPKTSDTISTTSVGDKPKDSEIIFGALARLHGQFQDHSSHIDDSKTTETDESDMVKVPRVQETQASPLISSTAEALSSEPVVRT